MITRIPGLACQHAPEPEQHTLVVLLNDLHRLAKSEQQQHQDDEQHLSHNTYLRSIRGSVKPDTSTGHRVRQSAFQNGVGL
jgi:hypothetical protein